MTVYATIPLQGATQEERLGSLRQTAEGLGVEVRTDEDGTRTAERRFGSLIVQATYRGDEGPTQGIAIDSAPAMTAREVRLGLADKDKGRHWAWAGACWCGVRHQAGETELTLIAPPWDISRDALNRTAALAAWEQAASSSSAARRRRRSSGPDRP
jgi:hypothetical protein